MKFQDSIQLKRLREHLVDKLRYKGISDEEILDAMSRVYRHAFVSNDNMDLAYVNRACPIDKGQIVPHPYVVAFQTQLIDVKKNDKVLHIGTGSGYQCAVLLEMGAQVFSIERNRYLYNRAKEVMTKLKYNPYLYLDDGYEGLVSHSPYDKIIVTAAACHVPPMLLHQLKVGGKLVMPIGHSLCQKMTLFEKISHTQYCQTEHGYFVYVPLIRGADV